MSNKFTCLKEFIDAIDMGIDIEFFLRNNRYNISWRNYKPFICMCPAGEAVFFENSDNLLNGYEVEGKCLKELWDEIEIYSM